MLRIQDHEGARARDERACLGDGEEGSERVEGESASERWVGLRWLPSLGLDKCVRQPELSLRHG